MRLAIYQIIGWIRDRPFITAGVTLIVALGALQVPLWERRVAVTTQHEEMRRNGEFMLHALTTRTQIEHDLAALRHALAQINAQLIDEQSMEVNLGYFYRLERA